MITLRDLLASVVALAIFAVIASVVLLVFLPSATAVPIVAVIGSLITTTIAPIITNIVVSRIVNPVKANQSEIHERLGRIEHDVNSTATEMAKRLEALRDRNVILEVAAQGHPKPPTPDVITEDAAMNAPASDAAPVTKEHPNVP